MAARLRSKRQRSKVTLIWYEVGYQWINEYVCSFLFRSLNRDLSMDVFVYSACVCQLKFLGSWVGKNVM
ncbi:hypothetical protein YC2023_017401 [Brassica napus]